MNFLCFWGAGLHFGGARRDSINSGSWWGFGGKAPPGLCGERSRERGWKMLGMVGKGRNRPRLRRGAAGDPRRYRPRAALPARHRGGGGRGRGRSRQSLPKIPSRGFFLGGGREAPGRSRARISRSRPEMPGWNPSPPAATSVPPPPRSSLPRRFSGLFCLLRGHRALPQHLWGCRGCQERADNGISQTQLAARARGYLC